MHTHAPGPYIIVPEAIEHPNGRFRFVATADWDEDAGRGHILAKLTDHPQIEGSAHLFAAAPDLYEAARSAYFRLQQLEPEWARSDEMRALKAALDKASPAPRPPRNPSEIAQARERGRKLGYDIPRFREEDCGGVFDGNQVISDADPGL